MKDQQKQQQFVKGAERATMAQLRKQREARTPHHQTPDWVRRYWTLVGAP